MESQLFSASKIFTERILRIPDYQRGYAWKEKQLKDFWADVIQLEPGKNHYIGVLTLEEVPEATIEKWSEDHWIISSKSYHPYYVVDGQQRLTTTIVLVQAITEMMRSDGKLNYTSLEEIRKKFIYDSKDNGISRSYIFGYEKDNPSYEFLKTKIFMESSDNASSMQETIYTRNLEHAKEFFIEKLKELENSEIEIIYRKVTQSLLFNIYIISNDIDVYVAFETMNNRGKPLSHLELLKNRLIYLSTKFNEEESERNHLRHTINEAWKSIYHYLGKNKEKPLDDDVFLLNHFVLYYGNRLIKKRDGKSHLRYMNRHYRDLYEDYLLEQVFTTRNINHNHEENKSISVKDVYSYVRSLKDSVEIWFQILNPKDSQFDCDVKYWLEKLNRLDILQHAPLIMIFFQTTSNQVLRVKFLRILEKFIFLMSLIRNRAYYYYNAGFEPIDFTEMSLSLSDKSVNPENIIKQIEQKFESLKNAPEFLTQMTQGFRKNGFYDWAGIKYFLYEYEVSLKERSKTYRDKIKWDEYIEDGRDYHTVEHIYPQRPRKECWTDKYSHYTEKERTALRHSLGNLVPLSQPKNSSFQNKCFCDKKKGEDNCIGFSYGSLSENEIAQHSEWTAINIMERGLKLLYFIEKRWDIPLGSTEEKLKFLNLEFVTRKENIDIKMLNSKEKPKRNSNTN
jgi:Protein of unknown function DUF262/Protein of unknown function (DUF1524)